MTGICPEFLFPRKSGRLSCHKMFSFNLYSPSFVLLKVKYSCVVDASTVHSKQYSLLQTVQLTPNSTAHSKQYNSLQTVQYTPNSTVYSKQYNSLQTVQFTPNSKVHALYLNIAVHGCTQKFTFGTQLHTISTRF